MSLKELYLVNNKISEINNISGLTKLTLLELGANRIRVLFNSNSAHSKEIKNLENLVNLENLWLGKNKIVQIEGLNNLVNLKKLSIQVPLFIDLLVTWIEQ